MTFLPVTAHNIVYEICGSAIENESKDLFQKTRNPLTEKNDRRKMILLIEKISVQKKLIPDWNIKKMIPENKCAMIKSQKKVISELSNISVILHHSIARWQCLITQSSIWDI